MTMHWLSEPMTGRLTLVWAACGEPVQKDVATKRPVLVTCKGCRKVMERDRERMEAKP